MFTSGGRFTPNVLAVVPVGLLLSSYATAWMGLKYIFGAFLFGVVMPREGHAAALREEILDRLEQVSVAVLLPVFFVVSGLSVNSSSVGSSGLVELCLILLVAVAGIRNDQQAVTNDVALHWNSGRVEGTVNIIKMIKRQMYGRAGFDLLRKRVMLHPA